MACFKTGVAHVNACVRARLCVNSSSSLASCADVSAAAWSDDDVDGDVGCEVLAACMQRACETHAAHMQCTRGVLDAHAALM